MNESENRASQAEANESSRRGPSPADPLAAAPLWRAQPYRVLFPLGFLLAASGVGHWWLHGMGWLADYRPVFHSIAQIQGFLLCFALGFLFTAVPRRTGTPPPAWWEMTIAVLAPIATAVAAWYQAFALSQVFWFVVVAMLLVFVGRRFLASDAGRRPPAGFVWIPVSFLMGLAGSVMIGLVGILGEEYYAWHEMGRLYLLQGLFLGLVIGVGTLFFPLVLQGANTRDLGRSPRDIAWVALHLAGAAGLCLSFWMERSYSLRGGLALRAGLVLVLLVSTGGIWRWPTVPGLHRRFLWLGAWLIPTGYILAACFPRYKNAGLHVVFIGGFALLALGVGMHVTLAHGGRRDLVTSWVWQVPLFVLLLLVAAAFRAMVDADKIRFFFWLRWSAGLFLAGLAVWGSLVFPYFLRRRRTSPE